MRHKGALAFTALAIAVTTFAGVGLFTSIHVAGRLTSRHWCMTALHRGALQVWWIRAASGVEGLEGIDLNVTFDDERARLSFEPRTDESSDGLLQSLATIRYTNFGVAIEHPGQFLELLLPGILSMPLSIPLSVDTKLPTVFILFRFPLFPIAALLLIYPTVVVIRQLRRQRRNQCLNCGYNVMGLTEARCPECGTTCESR